MADIRMQLFRIWFRLARPMTLGARAIVENAQGQVLLVRHTYTKGLFLPGGGVERGETIETSLRRELEEEGGVEVTGGVSLLGIYSNHKIMRNDHVALYRVAAEAWRPCGDPIGREISQIIWVDPLRPPGDATPGTLRRLREVYEDVAVSSYW